MPFCYSHLLLFLFFCCLSLLFLPHHAYRFTDVTTSAGLMPDPRFENTKLTKYGGASLADFNADGNVDILLGFHGSAPLQLFVNNGNGTFSRSRYAVRRDTHALNPVRLSPFNENLHFVLSRGGAYGWNPAAPHVYRTTNDIDTVIEETALSNFNDSAKGRGRSTIFLSLRNNMKDSISPDMLVLNARKNSTNKGNHFVFTTGDDNTFRQGELLGEFNDIIHSYATVADVDGDGRMEVIMLHELSIWKVTDDFTLSDITQSVLPAVNRDGTRNRPLHSVAALAELDYDNDGDWDLIMVRSATMDLRYTRRQLPRYDVLLRNDDGVYNDVSVAAGIPRGVDEDGNLLDATKSRGVTVGDFDNDGWVDIFIVRNDHDPAYILLRNDGNGRFIPTEHGFDRDADVAGDMATAVDYDGDGRLDLVLSEGDWFDKAYGGRYRLMRNLISNGNGYLLVRVKNAPDRSCTSLYAVVEIQLVNGTLNNGGVMRRRVGTPGTAVSLSYIETVHFGLGRKLWIDRVSVTWQSGVKESRVWVSANSTIEFGV